ncbi:hypothetical protein FRC07_012284, partial [Ceratobasidium sp. 392]
IYRLKSVVNSLSVDREAKAAATGRLYPHTQLPHALLDYLAPKNPATLKETIKEDNRALAKTHWEKSKAGIKFASRFPNADPRKFLERIRGLPRARATLLFQLITGHAPLQAHLARLQIADTPVCQHCGDAPETVAHYLLRCRSFSNERYDYLGTRGRDFLLLSYLFFSRDAT